MAQRQRVVTELARDLVQLTPQQIIRVAVDGVDGAGKTTFANELADAVRTLRRPVIRASVDGFHNPMAVRYERGRYSPEGYFENSYNYAALRQFLLDPLSPGGCRRYCVAVFDYVTDMPVSLFERQADPLSMLLFDGIFLHRPELLRYWDASIFLRVDFATSVGRCAARDGSSPDPAAPANRRYVEGQRMCLQACKPETQATKVIDNNDLSAPVLVAKR
jgi:uridine kinase